MELTNNKDNLDIDNKPKIDYLLNYVMTFFYHKEQIELIDYYLENIETIFKNISSNNKCEIRFDIIFMVSNIDFFYTNLENYLTKEQVIKEKIYNQKVYENNSKYVEFKVCIVKIKKYSYFIKIVQILSFPNSIVYNSIQKNKNKFEEYDIDYGNNSIGFKRYCNNILCWNIQKNLEKSKNNYNNVRVLSWQIDFGTYIGMPAILHSDIKTMIYEDKPFNLFENVNNKLKELSNYWYCSKNFLVDTEICKDYMIDKYINNDVIENIYSNKDFYYFLITHIDSVLNNFDILMFSALGIHDSKSYKIIYNEKTYNYSGFQNINKKITQFKPKNKVVEGNPYTNISKGHYDKCYIIDMSLCFIIERKKDKKPLTYNKNYTSFGEDILFTNILLKIKHLVVPHPFLAISKCMKPETKSEIKADINLISDNLNLLNIKKEKIELVYVLLPYDDVNNLKKFEFPNWINKKSKSVAFILQNNEINEFIEKQKENDSIKTIKGGSNILCDIRNKTDTSIYTKKVKTVKEVYDEKINQEEFSKINAEIINNLCVLFNKNIKKFETLLDNEYNTEYVFGINFENYQYNTLNVELNYNYNNVITNFIKIYLINGGECEKNDKFKNKYLKYKIKYLNLKKLNFI